MPRVGKVTINSPQTPPYSGSGKGISFTQGSKPAKRSVKIDSPAKGASVKPSAQPNSKAVPLQSPQPKSKTAGRGMSKKY